MSKKYIINYSAKSVEMSKPSSTILIYSLPYENVRMRNCGFEIPNPFIVYILFGRNNNGKDAIYVGKSKNGIMNRPTSHKNKYDNWTKCFVLTQFKERTFFNDGTIQYLEDRLNTRINKLNKYNNTTQTTTSGTANQSDVDDCDEYLEEAYEMLYALGLDLIDGAGEDTSTIVVPNTASRADSVSLIPDGEYFFNRKKKRSKGKTVNRIVHAKMKVYNGKFTVLKGSEVFENEGLGCPENIKAFRKDSNYVKDGKLVKNISFESPSAAGCFVLGAACNGWTNWKTADGIAINIYRSARN